MLLCEELPVSRLLPHLGHFFAGGKVGLLRFVPSISIHAFILRFKTQLRHTFLRLLLILKVLEFFVHNLLIAIVVM